jgi:hypothetical protein
MPSLVKTFPYALALILASSAPPAVTAQLADYGPFKHEELPYMCKYGKDDCCEAGCETKGFSGRDFSEILRFFILIDKLSLGSKLAFRDS